MVLPLAIAVGTLVRLAPCLRDPGYHLAYDAGYHERLTRELIVTGRLAEVDRMSEAPTGRHTARELPTGLYYAAATATRGLAALGLRDVRWALALFVALASSLIAVPCWLGTRALTRDPTAAALAAGIGVLFPAHVLRSCGFWLRYDGPGVMLIALHSALLLTALAESRSARRWGLAIGSGLALVAALAVWRVTLMVLSLEIAFVAYRLLTRGAEPALRDAWAAVVALGTIGMLTIRYLAEHAAVLSPLWLAGMGLALAATLPPLRAGGRWPARLAAVALVLAIAAIAGRSRAADETAGLVVMLAHRLGLAHGHDPLAALMLDVQELASLPPWRLLADPQQGSILGAWLVAAPLLLWLRAGRPGWRRALVVPPAPALLAALTLGLVGFTLLFQRTNMLLAPFAAMSLGVLGARLMAPPARARVATAGARRLSAAFVFSAIVSGLVGAAQGIASYSHLLPEQEACLRFLREHTPEDAVVLTLWADGYDVQRHAGRASVVDGMLESAENRKRILALDQALMDRSPARLRELCRIYSARWVSLPPATSVVSVAAVAGDPIAPILARGQPLVAGEQTDRVLIHLMLADVPVAGFRPAFTSGNYRIYEVVTDSVAAGGY